MRPIITTLCHHAECCILVSVMLSVAMLRVVMLSVALLRVVMLSIVGLFRWNMYNDLYPKA